MLSWGWGIAYLDFLGAGTALALPTLLYGPGNAVLMAQSLMIFYIIGPLKDEGTWYVQVGQSHLKSGIVAGINQFAKMCVFPSRTWEEALLVPAGKGGGKAKVLSGNLSLSLS